MMPLIATLGSHSALQILKGARDEGLANLVIAARGRDALYRRYPFVDEVLVVPQYGDVPALAPQLTERGAVMVPHGSFVAYLGQEEDQRLAVPTFGNRAVLAWEADRRRQRQWLERAGLTLPAEYAHPDEVERWPVLVKRHGAAGGAGYFLAGSHDALVGQLAASGDQPYTIQHYVTGVTLYIHYFQSPLEDRLEVLSMDRRYETTVDGLGRLPHAVQAALDPRPGYVVVGNSPLVLRESMLEAAFQMGERVVDASRELVDRRGLWGPFCLETIITPDMAFHVIEISCRIVAGTNLFIDGSPYAALLFDEPMSTGRRIAREVRVAAETGRLHDVVDGEPQPVVG
jgi:5-formaminoimidazole-4-carboxamide-1-(beta)-D-ribofuranosyl 5'-monophosphate synthetase